MMVDLVMERLPEFVRPADIVGAITNEVQIGGSQIGRIWINKKRGSAMVQVAEEVAEAVLAVMNSKKISGSEVKVTLKDGQDIERVHIRDYINKFKNLLYLERSEELVEYRMEMRHLTGEERMKLGHAILNLRGRAAAFPKDDFYQVRFILQQGETPLPPHEIILGDMVIISKDEPLTEGNPWGTVLEVEPTAITVGFRGEPPFYVYARGLRLDLAAHDQAFQMTIGTLKNLAAIDQRAVRLRGILLNDLQPEWNFADEPIECTGLDAEQQTALAKAIKSKDVLIIGGGAGTGKTTIGVEILCQSLKHGKKVLAVGTSASSRDVLAQRLEKAGLKVLKLADVNLKDEPEYYAINHLQKAIQKLMKKRDELTHPGGQWVEGLTYNDILENSGTGRPVAGVPGYRIKEMAEWIQTQKKIDEKLEEIAQHEDKIWKRLLSAHDILCITHREAGKLREFFDLILIDDAHMVNEPEILTTFFSGSKIILTGDKNQIAPQVINDTARLEGLGQSLFSRLTQELGDEWICHLETQHRMPPTSWKVLAPICTLGQKLESAGEREGIMLNRWCTGPAATVLDDKMTLTFLDTSQVPVNELRSGCEYTNRLEVDLVKEILEMGVDLKSMRERMAVLTFYRAQVEAIKAHLCEQGIEFSGIYTVEDFCGSERDLVIISLVHSNSIGYLGRVSSLPHLITAFTRARQKCIMIGNLDTFRIHPIYQRLLEEVNLWGRVYTL